MITHLHGDCRAILPTLPTASVQVIVTSPPYYALRDYGTAQWDGGDPACDHIERYTKDAAKSNRLGPTGKLPDSNAAFRGQERQYSDVCAKCGARRIDRQIGLEPLHDCLAWARGEPPCGACYVCTMRAVAAELWRVLRDDGTLWLNLGDSYANKPSGSHQRSFNGDGYDYGRGTSPSSQRTDNTKKRVDMPDKNLIGIPWRVALALQADGWILRNDNIWAKPNPMPESVTDRATKAHEYVFMFSKNPKYYYDAAAVAEEAIDTRGSLRFSSRRATGMGIAPSGNEKPGNDAFRGTSRNARTVWTIATQPYAGAHFAVFPEAIPERAIRAGSAAQACPHCGAAWRRVVERTDVIDASAKGSRFDRGKTGTNGNGRVQDGERYVSVAGDLVPACTCPDNDGSVRCVVLDPFAGSGTTLRVAARLQRDAIGIDLNDEYIALQEQRTHGVQIEMTQITEAGI